MCAESAKKIATRAIPDFRRGFMLSRYASALPYAVRPGMHLDLRLQHQYQENESYTELCAGQVLASSQSVTDGTGAGLVPFLPIVPFMHAKFTFLFPFLAPFMEDKLKLSPIMEAKMTLECSRCSVCQSRGRMAS